MQRVAFDLGSYAVGDMAWSLSQQQPLGTELPQGGLFIPAQGAVVPVGFDEGVAWCLLLCLLGDTGEAEVETASAKWAERRLANASLARCLCCAGVRGLEGR